MMYHVRDLSSCSIISLIPNPPGAFAVGFFSFILARGGDHPSNPLVDRTPRPSRARFPFRTIPAEAYSWYVWALTHD